MIIITFVTHCDEIRSAKNVLNSLELKILKIGSIIRYSKN
jgi:hypothetical protein